MPKTPSRPVPAATQPPIPSLPPPPAVLAPQPILQRVGKSGKTPERILGVKRGMIFWAEVLMSETRGSEQAHDVPSPWLVVSREHIHRMALVMAVPLSTKVHKGDSADFRGFRIRILQAEIERYQLAAGVRPMQECDSLALTEQTRVLAHDRLVGDPIATITLKALYAVEAGLKFVMNLA